jgi:hypothetical protein
MAASIGEFPVKSIKRLSILAGLALAVSASSAFALDPAYTGSRTGLGQDSPKEAAQLSNLKLTDPLVQQKYLAEPDMMRFLRGTYSEACARGLVNQATKQVKLDPKGEYPQKSREAAGILLESNRIWKMSSYEMEALFGSGYLNAANYCDCIMKEVSDSDLVNPRKGLDAVEKISKPAQKACESLAKEQTDRQVTERKKAGLH